MSTPDRRSSIGSSQIAAICGVHPYMSAFDVWSFIADGIETPDNEAMYWGRALEPVVLNRYLRDNWPDPKTTVYPLTSGLTHTVGIRRATPDALFTVPLSNETRIVEAKTARADKGWGDVGSDEIPVQYNAQVQWQCGVFEIDRADVAVLIAGSDFRVYTVKFDPEIYGAMGEQAEKFWKDHVEAKVAPPISATEGAKRWLKRFKPEEKTVWAGMEQNELATNLRRFRSRITNLEGGKEQIENAIKAFMAEATVLEGDGFRITWKPTKGRTTTDWEAAWTELANEAALRDVDANCILSKYRTTGEPTRRFLPKWEDE